MSEDLSLPKANVKLSSENAMGKEKIREMCSGREEEGKKERESVLVLVHFPQCNFKGALKLHVYTSLLSPVHSPTMPDGGS